MPFDAARPLLSQCALVTGASSGIGAEVARAFAAAGADVVVNYRSHPDEANQLVQEIGASGGKAMAVQADVSDEAQVEEMFNQIAAVFGSIDILVANAGIQQDAPFTEMSIQQWQRVIEVNLTGQFLCAREAVRRFLMRPERPDISHSRGKIICMSSVHEVIPWGGHVNYAASKGGVMLMMKSLAQEVAGQGIRVNAIAPGAIRTPINEQAWRSPEALEKLVQLIPYGRLGEPQDVAQAAVWLASDASDYVVGTTLFIGGGMALYPAFRDNG